jgi:hypothetical protein
MPNKVQYNKLLATLKVDAADDMSFLKKLNATELELLRETIENLFEQELGQQMERVAKVAKFIPNFLTAKIAETAIGPMVTARITPYIEVKDAISIMKSLSTAFMAETAGYLIPARTQTLINSLPMDMMKKVVAHLVRGHHFSVIGGFVEITNDDRVLEIANFIDSEADLCKITSFVEQKEKVVPVVLNLPERKVLKLIEASLDLGMEADILDIFTKMSHAQHQKVMSYLIKLPPASIQKIQNAIEIHAEKAKLSGLL